MTEVSAKFGDGDPIKVNYEFGDDLAGASKLFGDETVFANYKANAIVALQGFVRGMLKAEKSAKDITGAVAEWKPGVRKKGKTPQEKLREQFQAMSAEERAAFLQDANTK
jgi:hypothetical protein|tara:strand:+ start:904 stop:1233 length:330 start_codon:yes stop_codon:yes gene_type:complete